MQEAELSLKHSDVTPKTTGARLSHTREMRGLSKDEVARALCLNVEIINALEADDYGFFTAPIFAKGYLKNYATYLGLPMEGLFENTPANSYAFQNKAKKKTPDYGRPLLKLLNYLIIMVLMVLLFLWWNDRRHAFEKSFSLSSISLHQNPYPLMSTIELPHLIASTPYQGEAVQTENGAIQLMQRLLPWWEPCDWENVL